MRAVSLYINVSPQEGWSESYDPEGHFYFYKLISQ